MATFVLGYLLGSYEKKIPNWLLVLGAAGTLAVISVGTWLLTVRTGNSIRTSRIRAPGLRSCWPRVFSCCASRRATGRQARMGQGCVGLCCVAVDGDLPHAQHLPEHALFRRRVAAFVWRHGWRDTAGVCRVLCCDENGGDRQASVLPCHRQNVCRGVPQLQLGIYFPQAARTHRDENNKNGRRRKFLRCPFAPSCFCAAQRHALGHDGDVAQHDREIV